MNVFEVKVTYQGSMTYKIPCPTAALAKRRAEEMFEAFVPPDSDGHNDKIIDISVGMNQTDQTGGSDAVAAEPSPAP